MTKLVRGGLRNASLVGVLVLAGTRCAWAAAPDSTPPANPSAAAAPGNTAAAPAASTPAAPPPDKSGYTLFNPTPDADLRSFSTDRPNKSTTPYTVDAGHFQFETDLLGGMSDGYNTSHTQTRQFFTGDPVLKLGITNFADVEVALGGYQNYRVKDRTDNSTTNFDGFGDVVLDAQPPLVGVHVQVVQPHAQPSLQRETGPLGSMRLPRQPAIHHDRHAERDRLERHRPHLRLAAVHPRHHPLELQRLGLVRPEKRGHPLVD